MNILNNPDLIIVSQVLVYPGEVKLKENLGEVRLKETYWSMITQDEWPAEAGDSNRDPEVSTLPHAQNDVAAAD